MTTIYEFLNPNEPVKKGIVEMINTYGGTYGWLAIDGVIIEEVYKSEFPVEVRKRKFIKECVKLSGVSEDDLTFVSCDFEDFGDKVVPNFDANNYETYDDMLNLFKTNQGVPADCRVVAVGIEQLDENYY